jgi:hypothetical protein
LHGLHPAVPGALEKGVDKVIGGMSWVARKLVVSAITACFIETTYLRLTCDHCLCRDCCGLPLRSQMRNCAPIDHPFAFDLTSHFHLF